MLVYQRVENQPLVGGFNMFQPPEKYESQIGSSSQLLGKIKNVPNHQPATNIDMGLSEKWSPHSHIPRV